MGLFFLLALPLNILINATAAGAAALVCAQQHQQLLVRQRKEQQVKQEEEQERARQRAASGAAAASSGSVTSSGSGGQRRRGRRAIGGGLTSFTGTGKGRVGTSAFQGARRPRPPEKPKLSLWGHIKAGTAQARGVVPQLRPITRRLWHADILFNLQALPLQALSLLVLPVFWTMPRLLGIQVALPAAALGGADGGAALRRSQELMAGNKAWFAWPFIGLLAVSRLLDAVKQAALVAIPVRWWQDVVEVPILITVAFALAKLLVGRLQDLLPLAAYMQLAGLNDMNRAVDSSISASSGSGASSSAGGSGDKGGVGSHASAASSSSSNGVSSSSNSSSDPSSSPKSGTSSEVSGSAGTTSSSTQGLEGSAVATGGGGPSSTSQAAAEKPTTG